ncbi:MAG: hypothetical protein KY464_01840 [Gemmatimonadetes bacterium]|nr:hypothetical protein [Gemmatimonadota bacterium]
MLRSYLAWKRRYLTRSGAGGSVRVRMPDEGNKSSSEGVAYGMLLSAYLDDRPTFDGLWAYARLHRNARGLMAWEISRSGEVLDENAATDADQDVAFALLVADAKWGGYGGDARALIGALLEHTVEDRTFLLKPGDVWGGSEVTNPSYFAPAYYRVFARYTGDARWQSVLDASYQMLDRVAEKHGVKTGLQPDWASASGDSAAAAPDPGFHYGYNATRVPWRLAKDAAWNCEPRARRHLARLNAFFREVGAENIRDGYTLRGSPIGRWHNASFVAPAAAGAVVSSDSAFFRSMWEETVKLREGGYYSDSLRLLALLFASGRMPPPPLPRHGEDGNG